MKLPHLYTLALIFGLGACDSPTTESRVAPKPTVAPQAKAPLSIARFSGAQSDEPDSDEPDSDEPLDPRSVLNDEERRLLDADDATLTMEERYARADAQRKVVMADPNHPLRATILKLEGDVKSGTYAKMSRDMWSGRAAFPDMDEDNAPVNSSEEPPE